MFPVSIEILFFRVNDLSFLPVGYQYSSIAADLFFSFIYQDVERARVAFPLYQQRSLLVSKKLPGGATDEQLDQFTMANFLVQFANGLVRRAG